MFFLDHIYVPYNFQFLNKSVSLTSLSITNNYYNEQSHSALFDFIASHKTLTSFKFMVLERMNWNLFLYVYRQILMAVSQNIGIRVLNLDVSVDFGEDLVPESTKISDLFNHISFISEVLDGRDVMINGVHVDAIIGDLAYGGGETTLILSDIGMKFCNIGDSANDYNRAYDFFL